MITWQRRFTQHIDMPEVADMTGIDKTKADML